MQHQLEVKGMTCNHCEQAVRRAILSHDPQANITIDIRQNAVAVQSTLSGQALVELITDEGYNTRIKDAA